MSVFRTVIVDEIIDGCNGKVIRCNDECMSSPLLTPKTVKHKVRLDPTHMFLNQLTFLTTHAIRIGIWVPGSSALGTQKIRFLLKLAHNYVLIFHWLLSGHLGA